MNSPDNVAKAIDPIIAPTGDFGLWQFYISMLIFISKFGTGTHTTAITFLAAPMHPTCVKPNNDTDVCSADCQQVAYDHTNFEENIISQWGLICDRAYLQSLEQSLVMVGIMLGSFFFGILSDKYGRRPAFLSCCYLQLVVSVLVPFMPSFWLHCLVRGLVGFATGGTMTTSFVIIMEIVGPKHRELMSILYQTPFNLGHALLPLIAYYLRNWKHFYLALALFHLLYLPYFFAIPETPRWLFSTGQVAKSSEVLTRAAKLNKRPTQSIRADLDVAYQHKISLAGESPKKSNLLQLFVQPNLRLKTLVIAFDWLAVCLCYYGVAQYTTQLSGNIFLNVAFGALLALFGTVICVPLTIYTGRKPTQIMSNLLSAICLLALCFLSNAGSLLRAALASLGLFGSAVTFANSYLYAGELFPTVVRNSGLGFCSFIGRFGSIVAPFVALSGSYGEWIPPAIFGGFSLIAAFLTLILPETRGQLLPETIEDGENFGSKRAQQQEEEEHVDMKMTAKI